ncbi:MAG: alpha/beta fold hydrolase [Gordonia sp. (in: high G+C Gram-positive bacteria)]|uniref:alpha/beta fold hydrolase n=1 Tax=Gordonia sp. (in: high G+C Gram-positive bacteria) TaxID=84139 RepID=UPI0039E5D433
MSAPETSATAATAVPTPPVRLEYRTIHGYRRAFRIAGSGPAILLIHGITDNSSTWDEVIGDLARTHTVIAPDLLGHGLSDKPRADYSVAAFANGMRDLLVVLGISKVTVVGHSLGGGVAMQFCYQFPRFVERAVLVAPGGVSDGVTPFLRMAALPGARTVMRALSLPGVLPALRGTARALSRIDDSAGLPERLAPRHWFVDHPDLLRVVGDLTDSEAQAAFVRTLRSAVDWRGQSITTLDRAHSVENLPLLMIWGDRDPVIPARHAELFGAVVPSAQVEMFPGSGHFPFHDDPERFVGLVEDFIALTDPIEFDPVRWRELMSSGQRIDGFDGDQKLLDQVRLAMEDERNAS